MLNGNNFWVSVAWLSVKVLIVIYAMGSGVTPFIYQRF